MKGKGLEIIQLLLSIVVFVVFDSFFFKILSIFNLSFTGMSYTIMNFLRYLITAVIIYIIYRSNIKSGKRGYNKTLINNIIYSVSCFVFLIVITVLLHELLNYVGKSNGIIVGYNFTNYFSKTFTVEYAFQFIIECFIVPFLLCIIFSLGFANIIKNDFAASLVSGISYGVLYAISLHTTLLYAVFNSITGAAIMFTLTYLYKANKNIYSVIVTYIIYVLFGIFAINYIL